MLSSDLSHLREGVFDSRLMIDTLDASLKSALEDRHVGLWASGDMGWEFGAAKDFSKLIEYERALEAFLASHDRLRGVCQYHTDLLPLDVPQVAAITHPTLYVNETLSKLNPEYVPA